METTPDQHWAGNFIFSGGFRLFSLDCSIQCSQLAVLLSVFWFLVSAIIVIFSTA